MSPTMILLAIRQVINAYLSTYRNKYPPTVQQIGEYRYGMLRSLIDNNSPLPDAEDPSIHEKAVKAKELFATMRLDASTLLLTKTLKLLLYLAVPESRLREFAPTITKAVDECVIILREWATVRSVGLIGYYYRDLGLNQELTEELPHVDSLVDGIAAKVFERRAIKVIPKLVASGPDRMYEGEDGAVMQIDACETDLWTLKGRLSAKIEAELGLFAPGDDISITEVPVFDRDGGAVGWVDAVFAVEYRTAEDQKN